MTTETLFSVLLAVLCIAATLDLAHMFRAEHPDSPLPRCPLCGHEVWSWPRHVVSRVLYRSWRER